MRWAYLNVYYSGQAARDVIQDAVGGRGFRDVLPGGVFAGDLTSKQQLSSIVLKLHFSLGHHSLAGAADSHDRQPHTLRQSKVSSVEGVAQQGIALL